MVGESAGESEAGPQRVAVIIPCRDARKTISSTVRACRAIPGVDLVVIVDDGSTDDTAQVARAAGAVAVRHSVMRGRASAMETGIKVAAMRDRADWPSRCLLFLDPDLGDSAVEATALVDAVVNRVADCAIAVEEQPSYHRDSLVGRIATKGIRRTTGWQVNSPLSTQRCITRQAINAVMPFSSGWGADVGMTIDLLVEGYSVVEVPCNFYHSGDEQDPGNILDPKYRDIWLAVQVRRVMRQRIPLQQRLPMGQQKVGRPYQMGVRRSGS